MTRTIIPLLLLALGAAATEAAAAERRYLAGLDESRWIMSTNSPLSCVLEHSIPRFGRVVFRQEAGRALTLDLVLNRRFAKGINVELRSETTGWNNPGMRKLLGRFEISGKRRPLEVSSDMAARVMSELRSGYQPGFLFYTDDPFIASLSTVGYRPAEIEFDRCVAGLHRDNFFDVRVSNIFFEPDHEFASIEQENKAFRRMLAYLAVDDGIREIVVTGHADRTGRACYNDGLSQRRADYVHDLLLSLGIDPELIRIDYAGEDSPRQKGNSKASLAANRRVSVELRR